MECHKSFVHCSGKIWWSSLGMITSKPHFGLGGWCVIFVLSPWKIRKKNVNGSLAVRHFAGNSWRLKAVFRSPFQRWWSDLKIEAMKKGDFFGCETNHHVQVPGDKCWVLRLQPNQLSGFSSSGTKKIQVYTKNSCQALLGVGFPLHTPYTYSLYKGEYLYLHFRYLECLVK